MIIPLWMRALAAIIIFSVIAGIGWSIHRMIWRSGYNKAMQEVEVKTEADRVFKQEGIDNVSSTFVAKAAKSRTIVQSNAEKVAQYAPDTFPPLPGSFRLWHDAAAAGKALDDTGRIDAPSVSLKATASTIAYNYAACLYDQQRLESLQAIVKTINGEEP